MKICPNTGKIFVPTLLVQLLVSIGILCNYIRTLCEKVICKALKLRGQGKLQQSLCLRHEETNGNKSHS